MNRHRIGWSPAALGLILLAASAGCMNRPAPTGTIIRVAVASSPNNLDPRLATDDFSVKASQLIFSTLMGLDDRLHVVPELAERLDQPTPLTYVATLRKGVRFHDGHELTSDDVVFTFRCLIDPGFVSPRKGGYRELQSVDALDRYTVVFMLKEPFPSFPVYLVLPIVPAGAHSGFAEHPIGTGPYRFVRYLADDQVELRAFSDHYAGRPANDGIILRVVPDDVMRGLELRKGTVDIVVNDLAPDIVRQLRTEPRLQTVEAPGVDYQYIGLNVSDPILASVSVRRALAHAIDRDGIVEHLRQGLAVPAAGMMPPLSWAIATDVPLFPTDPARARTLLDEAGYPDPDGNGPGSRFHLTLKISNTESNRLQAAVIQENLQRVGIALEVRTYDFATMYADVLSGNFQLFTMQWTGESLADPDILRRVFHSAQTPPVGFNRGRFVNARIDALLDGARAETDRERRRTLYGEAQRLIADEVPYVSLWHKTNVAIAQRSLSGVRLSALGDFTFLKQVSRVGVAHAN